MIYPLGLANTKQRKFFFVSSFVLLLAYACAYVAWLHSFVVPFVCPYIYAYASAASGIADFLRGRFQRVKISSECYSSFMPISAGIPQWTKIGPWLFLTMINDLGITVYHQKCENLLMIPRFQKSSLAMVHASEMQETVKEITDWTHLNRLQLNPTKCKEMRISFKSVRAFMFH